MNDTMYLGQETPGRPTVRGVVVIKVAGQQDPGFAWSEGAGKSVSLIGISPADAARMRPMWGGLEKWQIERREIQYWRSYTPPKTGLVDRLKAAVAAARG
jgi:hypothetical protein